MDNREETESRSIRIRIYGVVQGVGFRPFAVRLALLLGIAGTVKNSGGMVEIVACAGRVQLDEFIRRLLQDKPAQAMIVHYEIEDIPPICSDSFVIEPSGDTEGPVFLSPDLRVCDACLRELADVRDKRFAHPFISCMACGPRYSIIEDVPYDRVNTTMTDFPLCEVCGEQYRDRADRRYHAQTISCHSCGPFLLYRDSTGETMREAALQSAVRALRGGGVIAVKGIGGYHLCCNPYNESAVLRLRRLKNRELKPFAVMFPDTDETERHAVVSQEEKALLLSEARPIVLLRRITNSLDPAVCGDSRFVGAFLPYTPLHKLLTEQCGPLVMTSANVSDEPIVKDDGPMLAWPHLDGVLYNERRIAARVDDSITRVVAGQPQIVRRSRGYVPLPILLGDGGRGRVLAVGGQLKAVFCLASGRFAYMGPHVGDLDNDECLAVYRTALERLRRLLRISPELAVCDGHPGYASTELAEETGLPLLRVQHHHAHIASVMAEHGLEEPVIGVAFDGTGWGGDGTVWGGEFFICENNHYKRAGHIKAVRFLGGDESIKDASKSAMCYLHDAGLDAVICDERWPLVRAALEHGVNTHGNSGMGRLFDAVSAILDVWAYNRYEGECAIRLENMAAAALERGIAPAPAAFALSEEDGVLQVDSTPVIRSMAQGTDCREALALGFHRAVSDMVLQMVTVLRRRTGIAAVALSGGVFQNTVLLERTMKILEAEHFSVYINRQVPPGDGGISLGQAQIGLWHLAGKEYKPCV